MNNATSILINILVIILGSIAFLTAAVLLGLIFYHRRQFPINTPTFLMCNTFVSVIFLSILLIDMYARYLYIDFNTNVSFDDGWCYLRTYFLYVSVSLLFHSYLIQTGFRFVRVIFYRYKHLQTPRFMLRIVLIQWLTDFLCVLPFSLRHHFHYIPEHYYCDIVFNDTLGMVTMGTITYNLSVTLTGFIYSYILYYMKKNKAQSILQNRHQGNQRDLVVLRRIIILLGMLFTLGMPSSVIWFEYISTGYVNPIGYHIKWSLFTLSISTLPTVSAFITPQLREIIISIWRHNRRIQPTITL